MAGLARSHLERALALRPDPPDAHLVLALVHRLEGDEQAVLDELQRAQRLDPADARIAEWTAKSCMALGRPGEAVTLLEKAVTVRPKSYALGSALADCNDMLGHREANSSALARCRDALASCRRPPGFAGEAVAV
jgi:Flp pilus assembly protein TadD